MESGAKNTIIFAVSVFILTLTSYFITPLAVQDTNPSSYVIVPILMLPLFALFMLKDQIVPQVRGKDILLGIVLFFLFIIAYFLLRLWLSFSFLSFRADLLIMPIALASFSILLFGSRNVNKFKEIMIYTAIAAPAVLWPVLQLNNTFALANTLLIYATLKPFIKGIYYLPKTVLSTPISEVNIGVTCVNIGIFLALLFFVIPVAYLYSGKLSRKLEWIVSGLALLLLLNYLRMLFITYYWLNIGPNKTVLLIHAFAGQILFYVVIIAMILLSRMYGLSVKKRDRKEMPKAKRQKGDKLQEYSGLLVLTFSIVYLLLTLNYAKAQVFSPVVLTSQNRFNLSNASVAKQITAYLFKNGYKSLYVTMKTGLSIFVWNNSINSSDPLLIYVTKPGLGTTEEILKNNHLKGKYFFFDNEGMSSVMLDIISNKTEFFIYIVKRPFIFANNTSLITNTYLLIPAYLITNHTYSCTNTYDYIYTAFYNVFNPYNYNQTEKNELINAYCIAEKVA